MYYFWMKIKGPKIVLEKDENTKFPVLLTCFLKFGKFECYGTKFVTKQFLRFGAKSIDLTWRWI